MGTYLIINTSPRPKANCKDIAARVKATAEAAGHKAKVVDFEEGAIRYCAGCEGCQKKSGLWCSRNDALCDLLPEINSCDDMLLLSPVYWGDVTAQAKTIVNRMYAFIDFNSPSFSKATKIGKKLALVFTSRGMPQGGMDAAVNKLATAFGCAGFGDHRALTLSGTHEFGAVAGSPSMLAEVDDIAGWLLS